MGAPDLSEVRASGQCLCGSVKYEVRGPLRAIVECHCRTCRRLTGGLWHATAARRGDVTIDDGGTLRWYRSSPPVRRGFCGNCGSWLFLDGEDRPFLVITASGTEFAKLTLDGPLVPLAFISSRDGSYELLLKFKVSFSTR